MPLYQILFIFSLFLIVLLALEMEALLGPNVVFLALGAVSLIFGIVLFGSGNIRKGPVASPGEKKSKATSGCLAAVVGGMYALIGMGMLVLQFIGHLYSR